MSDHLAENNDGPIGAEGAKPITYRQESLPDTEIIIVHCSMCSREIWTQYHRDGLSHVCRSCMENIKK
jgi:hypothetical protein